MTVHKEFESAELSLVMEEIVVKAGYTKTFLVVGIGKSRETNNSKNIVLQKDIVNCVQSKLNDIVNLYI